LDLAHPGHHVVVGGTGAALERAAGQLEVVLGDVALGDGLAHAGTDRAAGEDRHREVEADAVALAFAVGRQARQGRVTEVTPAGAVAVVGAQGDPRQVLGAGRVHAVRRGPGVVLRGAQGRVLLDRGRNPL